LVETIEHTAPHSTSNALDIAGRENRGDHPTMDSTTKEERTWAMFAHLSTFAGHFIPFGHIIGPLVIWMIKKDELPLVNDQGKEALNFQITMTFAFIVAALSLFIVVGFVLLPAVWLFDVIVTIIAAVKANEGVAYRYPLCLRLVN
jgi:uncharacterized Tic20 family protein